MNNKKPKNSYLSAYKLYISENASTKNLINPKYWDILMHGDFSLNAKNINQLIKNSLALKHKFPNERFSDKDHGKGLENNFELIEKWMSSELLEDFASLFKVETYQKFIINSDLTEKYLRALEIRHGQTFSNPNYYIMYYWNGKSVGKAILEFDNKTNTWDSMYIQYFHYSETKKIWIAVEVDKSPNETPVTEKAKIIGNNLHVYVRTSVPTFLIIHSSDGNFKKQSFFCTYSTSYLGHPFSGIGILEKVSSSSKNQAIMEPISAHIFNCLFQRATFLESKEEGYSPSPGELNFSFNNDLFEAGDHYNGVYKGYYLDKDFDDNSTAIRTLLLEIKPSGEVVVNDGEASGPLSGFCSITADKQIMYITCDFRFQPGGIPRFQIIIDMPQEMSDKLEGVYGGYSKKNQPYIGLIILKKIPDIHTIAETIKTNNKPHNFKKGNQTEKKFAEIISDDVLKYFIDAKYYNSPDLCIDTRILNKFLPENNKIYEGPTGVFYAYSTSSLKKGIVRYPVIVEKDGLARIKTANDFEEIGVAFPYFQNNFLILNFYKPDSLPNKRPSKGVFIFSTAHKEISAAIPGISLRVNDDDKAQSKREFLVPIDTGSSNSLKSQQDFKAIFKSLKFQIIYPNRSNDVDEDLMRALLGREYNLIVVSKDIKRREKILQRHDFKKLYFFEALFELQKNKLISNKPFKESLKQAIEHGLLTEQVLATHLHEYSAVHKIQEEKIFNKILPVFISLLEEYNK